MGHEQTSTTLNRYTHRSDRRDGNVRSAFADFSLTDSPDEGPETTKDPSEEESRPATEAVGADRFELPTARV